MGLVLAFETAPRQPSRQVARRTEKTQDADILFFTGVRYERGQDSRKPEPARPGQPYELPSSHQ